MNLFSNLFSRYVLAELLKVFAVALASLTLLMLLVGVMRQALDEGVGLKHIALLMPYILPDALRFTIPATVLFAAACVYGRMSGTNELVALKSAGISPLAILVPTLVLAFFLSWATVWLNDVAVSWGRAGVRRVVINALEDIVLARLRMKKNYSTRYLSVIVKDVQGHTLINPTFSYRDKQKNERVIVRCDRARIEADDSVLRVTFSGHIYFGDKLESRNSDIIREFPLDQFRDTKSDASPSNKSLREIYNELKVKPGKIAAMRREHAAQAAFQLLGGDLAGLAGGAWGTAKHRLHQEEDTFNRLRTEPPRRVANGFSCLCFLLVGSAMGIRRRNADVLSSFFMCFVPILLVYYPLLAFGVDQAKAGALPPYAVWLGNVILVFWGVWLWRRVLRY